MDGRICAPASGFVRRHMLPVRSEAVKSGAKRHYIASQEDKNVCNK